MTASSRQDAQGLGPMERVLRLFSEIRPGEGGTVLTLAAIVLLLLCSYYLVKPLREGWLAVSVVSGLSKMEVKAYSGFGQSVLLALLMSGYGRVALSSSRRGLISGTLLVCMACLVVFWLLQPGFFFAHLPGTGVLFYLWVGMFGVFLVAQFWAFAADLYDDEEGRRLIPVIAIGATGGAVVGSWLSSTLVESRLVGTEHLLLAAIVPLALALLLVQRVVLKGPSPPPPAPEAVAVVAPHAQEQGALGVVLRDRLLLALALVTLLLSWVNTNGENILFRVVQEVLEESAVANGGQGDVALWVRDETTRFYGDFFFWVNLTALLLQGFVASRLLRLGGFAAIFLLLPVVGLLSYTVMALVPVLAVIRITKVAENATDYSISNTARHVFWLPLPREVTYRAKPAIDTLFARLGDGFAAVTVLVGVQVLAASAQSFILLNVALLLGWLSAAIWIVKRHRRIAPQEVSRGRR